jgi:hypothetical protein
MALWLSGSLVAPDDLYTTILDQLSLIRELYGEDIPQLRSIIFHPHWESNSIAVELSEEARVRYAAGEYDDLDSLNTRFNLKWKYYTAAGWLTLTFEGRYHSYRLREIYAAVPSVVSTADPPPDIVCSPPGVYPWFRDSEQ